MSKQLEIYLDLDGILADWTGAVCDWADKPRTPWLSWHYHKNLGITDEDLHGYMKCVSFWKDLKPLKKGMELWKALVSTYGADAVTIATTPFISGNSLYGKNEWTEKHLGWSCDKVIYIKDKGRLAHPNAVLIDDGVHQIESFQNRGGHGIIYKRPWNTCVSEEATQTIEDILAQVEEIKG